MSPKVSLSSASRPQLQLTSNDVSRVELQLASRSLKHLLGSRSGAAAGTGISSRPYAHRAYSPKYGHTRACGYQLHSKFRKLTRMSPPLVVS